MFDILSNLTPENGFKASSDRWTQLNNKVEHSHRGRAPLSFFTNTTLLLTHLLMVLSLSHSR